MWLRLLSRSAVAVLLLLWWWWFVFDPCFVIFLVLQASLWGRGSWLLILIVFLVSCDCKCSVSLPRYALYWSAVYGCNSFCLVFSYPLCFLLECLFILGSVDKVTYFLFFELVCSSWFLLLWILLLFMFHIILVMLSCLAASWLSAGKRLTSWLSCELCFLVFLSLSHMVLRVRYSTWLYRFLIFAFISTVCIFKLL